MFMLYYFAFHQQSTRQEWQTVFFFIAVIQVVGFVFFLIFGSGELQPWDGSNQQDTEVTNIGSNGYHGSEIKVCPPIPIVDTELGFRGRESSRFENNADETTPLLR